MQSAYIQPLEHRWVELSHRLLGHPSQGICEKLISVHV